MIRPVVEHTQHETASSPATEGSRSANRAPRAIAETSPRCRPSSAASPLARCDMIDWLTCFGDRPKGHVHRNPEQNQSVPAAGVDEVGRYLAEGGFAGADRGDADRWPGSPRTIPNPLGSCRHMSPVRTSSSPDR